MGLMYHDCQSRILEHQANAREQSDPDLSNEKGCDRQQDLRQKPKSSKSNFLELVNGRV